MEWPEITDTSADQLPSDFWLPFEDELRELDDFPTLPHTSEMEFLCPEERHSARAADQLDLKASQSDLGNSISETEWPADLIDLFDEIPANLADLITDTARPEGEVETDWTATLMNSVNEVKDNSSAERTCRRTNSALNDQPDPENGARQSLSEDVKQSPVGKKRKEKKKRKSSSNGALNEMKDSKVQRLPLDEENTSRESPTVESSKRRRGKSRIYRTASLSSERKYQHISVQAPWKVTPAPGSSTIARAHVCNVCGITGLTQSAITAHFNRAHSELNGLRSDAGADPPPKAADAQTSVQRQQSAEKSKRGIKTKESSSKCAQTEGIRVSRPLTSQ